MKKSEIFLSLLIIFIGFTTYSYFQHPDLLQKMIDTIYEIPDTVSSYISDDTNIVSTPSYSKINVQITNSMYENNISCNSILTRYDIDYALKCMLSGENRTNVQVYANKLKSTSKVQTVWNILEFVDKNIKYDKGKESKLPIVYKVYPSGRIEIIKGRDAYIQTPYETIQRGKGICSDYTILILALLLDSGFDTVYAMEIEGSSDGHIVPIVEISGWYFVMDQHLPPMDLEGFVKTYNGNIKTLYWYEITKKGNSVEIRKSLLSVSDVLNEKYEATILDFNPIRDRINIMLSNNYGVNIDSKLPKYFSKEIPTVKYTKILRVMISFKNLALLYNPIFEKQYVEYLYSEMFKMSNIDLDGLLKGAKAVYVNFKINKNDLEMIVYIGI